jgi:EAL domain-containing protein (putative c-di-GMP-specific phosphodiesterase class I)
MTAVAYTLHRRADSASPSLSGGAVAGWLREDAREIIEQRRFALTYQPIVSLADRDVVASEALLRLQPPSWLPALPVATFVALAANWGLATALDAAVLEVAAKQAATPISVNIAGRSLQDAAFVAGLAGSRLVLEVTAASGIDDSAAAASSIAALRASGTRVWLDDLGADAATLDLMRVARFDAVKFAGGITRTATSGARGRQLVTALVSLAARTEAQTIAKCVETLPQAWLLQDLGVTCGQGWLFGAPGKLAIE